MNSVLLRFAAGVAADGYHELTRAAAAGRGWLNQAAWLAPSAIHQLALASRRSIAAAASARSGVLQDLELEPALEPVPVQRKTALRK